MENFDKKEWLYARKDVEKTFTNCYPALAI